MQFGEVELYLLSDGVVHVDAGGPFGLVPKSLYQNYFEPDDKNLIPMTLNCLLIRSDGKWILIDTGLGEKLSPEEVKFWGLERPKGGLREGLARFGISPEDIDWVINTHLHSDHCGGNTYREGDQIRASFPNATYLVQRLEWAEFSHPDARTKGAYYSENFSPLLEAGQAILLHGDTPVTRHVSCVIAPGHTRGHQCVVVRSGGRICSFMGDLASYAVHMQRTSWVTSYDIDPLRTITTKMHWQHWALGNKALLFFQHDPNMPIARLTEEDGRLIISPVEGKDELMSYSPTRIQPRE